jgi:PAS domain S-box-containing protein
MRYFVAPLPRARAAVLISGSSIFLFTANCFVLSDTAADSTEGLRVEPFSGFCTNRIDSIEILLEGDGLVFGRGCRGGPGGERKDVLIVRPSSQQPTSAALDRLAREYSFKDELDSKWAARPLELVRDRGRNILLLEDPGGELLDGLLGVPMDVGGFLRIAIGVAAAIGKVHEHGLIHKDIRPANVLVNTASAEVRLTGFGIASRLPREHLEPGPPDFMVGTLPYMAPEQSGRMNRSIDSRSDLYSLGVTFYQMLTGVLPFSAHDPLEWVHCHIAITPMPPSQRLATIPAPISQLVMKLLAKTGEERYQTAAGIEHDLRRCHAEWEKRGRIDAIPLAEHDVVARLLIPEKLYGRGYEVEALLGAFQRVVATGVPELVLVSGYSGIGKSSVVHELHKVLVPPRGLFATGKFDQFMRDIPYATVAQAFQGLVRQILSKNETELWGWRDALAEALGPNGLLIVDIIPELELVIGKQPPVAELPPLDAQRRFQMVFRRFMGVFARQQHPLALFLDDLQWLDAATLDLLEDILTQSDIRYLLLIGAYRDNEVDLAHPLLRKLDAIRRAGATVQDIVLAPLTYDDLGQLISDSLRCETKRADPLVRLLHEKTGGNPFFAIQFLSALEDEALLVFDHADARWSWDLDRIHSKRYTDNVADLMVGKLGRLPAETQAALCQLACVGSRAAFAILGTVCEASQDDLHGNLWEAVRAGLVLRSDDSYAFQHDRIQEAAYSLIPDDVRAEAHLRIGRLLLTHTPPEKRQEIIFEIVSQFNRSKALIVSQDEREKLAQLNLIAGKRAKKAAAYLSALTLLAGGRALLADDCWAGQYPLTFELEFHRAECEFLTGDLENAERRLSMLASRAEGILDLATVTSLRLEVYIMLAQSERFVDVGLDYLRQIGIEWSPHPTDDEVRREFEQLWQQLKTRAIENLIDLPLMTEPGTLATMSVLSKLVPSGNNTDSNLDYLIVARMVNLTLQYGNSNASCLGYVSLALALAADLGDHSTALRFAQLSVDLVEKRGLNAFKARIYLRIGGGISPLTHHFRFGRSLLLQARDEAEKIGDVLYASHCRSHIIKSLIASGEPLDEVEREAIDSLDVARKTGSSFVFAIILNKLYLIRRLRGRPLDLRLFDNTEVDESDYEQYLDADPNLTNPAYAYWTRKLQACVFSEDYASALGAATKAQGMLLGPSPVERAEYHFYAALAQAGFIDTVDDVRGDQQTVHREALAAHLRQLRIWAERSPENFENRAALIAAELARLEGRNPDAERLYEQAIRSARANGFVHNEALSCEAAARFYAARGVGVVAELLLERARDGYLRWGAEGKVRQLEAHYPQLVRTDQRSTKSETTSPDQQLDVAAVVKASQALSSEMRLPSLIERLMTLAIQNAGADRGLLILLHENDYRIEAEARADGETIALYYGTAAGQAVPEAIVRYVIRTQECVILNDAAKRNLFSEDPYFDLSRQRSIFCLPLIRQGTLVGLLYLENALASHAFTPNRAKLLGLLGSQAAISLENARLYGDLQEREAKVRRLVDSNIIGICIFDFDRRIVEANDAFLNIVDYSRDDVISGRLSFTGLTPPEWIGAEERLLAELASTGTSKPCEKVFFRKDGSRVSVLVGGATFGELRHQGVVFVLDLTEQKRSEQDRAKLRKLEADLAHINRVSTLGELASSIAHELKQPITATMTNASASILWLDRKHPDIEEALQAAQGVAKNMARARDIIDRLRALYSKTPPKRERVSVNEIIGEMVIMLQSEASRYAVSIGAEVAPDVPDISADRVQLQQVLMNLMLNAVEAMKDTGGLLTVRVQREDGMVLITVSDTGIGLPAENVDRIFDAFFTTKSQGSGMGLAISRSIVESHGGRLWAAPNGELGTRFHFALPVGTRETEA